MCLWGTCFLVFCSPNGSNRGRPPGPKASAGSDLAVPLLRVNDWLLRINDVDLINKDKKQAMKALLNGEGAINMVVRRRKSLGGKVVTPLHINLSGHKGRGWGGGQGTLFSYREITCVFGHPSFPEPGVDVVSVQPMCFTLRGRLGPGSCLSLIV